MKKFLIILQVLLLCFFNCVFFNLSASAGVSGYGWRFDDYDGFLNGAAIDGLTISSKVTRGKTVHNLKGEYYRNYISFENDGNTSFSAVQFGMEDGYTVYVVADTLNSNPCLLWVGDKYRVISKGETKAYKFECSSGVESIFIEPSEAFEKIAQIRIYAIYVVPNNEYEVLEAGEGRYYRFDEFDFESTTITESIETDGLTVLANEDYSVSVDTGVADSEAGIRYHKSVDLDGAGNNSGRSISFTAEPMSDIYITARSSDGASQRTLYVTNKYSEDFYYEGENLDIAVDGTVRCYKITYTGEGEELYIRSKSSGIRIYDIRIVGHEESHSVVMGKSWNFSTNSAFTPCTITDETEIDGLKIYGSAAQKSYVSTVNESGYTKAVDLTEGTEVIESKIGFEIGDSSGIDKERKNKAILITARSNDGASPTAVYIIDKYGMLVGSFTANRTPVTYTIPYDGYNSELYLYTKNQPLRIYKIEITTYEGYDVVWNASDMETGVFTEYNGLSSISGSDLTVTENSRFYDGTTYQKTIKTNGSFSNWSNYIPTNRALKFTTAEPCYITILAYGTSSGTITQPMYITRAGKLVANLTLKHNDLTSNTVFLNKAETYYIFCPNGSIGVSYIELHMLNGDINGDLKTDKDDLTALRQMLYDSAGVDSALLEFADFDGSGSLDENDFSCLSDIVLEAGNYVPTYFSNKVWNMSSYTPDTTFAEEQELDGLVIIPKHSVETSPDVDLVGYGYQYYKGTQYSQALSLNGCSTLDTDKTVKYRGVKIYTSEPCDLVILVRTANTDDGNVPNLTVTKKGAIVSQTELLSESDQLDTTLQAVKVHLDEPNEYYIGNTTGGLRIFSISLTQSIEYDMSSEADLTVKQGDTEEVVLYASGISTGEKRFLLTYDSTKLKLESIKTQGRDLDTYVMEDIILSENITVEEFTEGCLIFTFTNDTDNFSGAVGVARFTVTKGGIATVNFAS